MSSTEELLSQASQLLNEYKVPLITVLSSVAVGGLLKRYYFSGGRCYSKTRLDGKTVIITGGNTGIGKETGLDLASRGARVILACRDMSRGEDAAKFIRTTTGNGNVEVKLLDLANISSIKKFSEEIHSSEKHVDILINNAGIMMCPELTTDDGFEMQFGVNHLGHFLLTNLLLDILKKSTPSRIINVSSKAHESGEMNFDDLMSKKNYNPRLVYSQSKLANILFTIELNKKLSGSGVTTYSLHPGVVATELTRHLPSVYPGWILKLLSWTPLVIMMKTPEQGAQTTIHCAVTEGLEKSSGKYFSDCQLKETSYTQKKNEDEMAKKLWEVSEKLVDLKQHI